MSENELLERVINNDKEAFQELQLFYIPLVEKIASRYKVKYWYKIEDILSTGYEGMLSGVINIWNKTIILKRNNKNEYHASGYIAKKIFGKITNFIHDDFIIPIARSSLKDYLSRNKQFEILSIETVENKIKNINTDNLVIEDIIKSMKLTKNEETVLTYRFMDYSIRDIAALMNCKKHNVCLLIERLKRKYIHATAT